MVAGFGFELCLFLPVTELEKWTENNLHLRNSDGGDRMAACPEERVGRELMTDCEKKGGEKDDGKGGSTNNSRLEDGCGFIPGRDFV